MAAQAPTFDTGRRSREVNDAGSRTRGSVRLARGTAADDGSAFRVQRKDERFKCPTTKAPDGDKAAQETECPDGQRTPLKHDAGILTRRSDIVLLLI